MGFSTLKLFGAKVINVQRSPDATTYKVIIITVVVLLCLTLLRAVKMELLWPRLEVFLGFLFTLFPDDVLEASPRVYYLLLYLLVGISVNTEDSIPSKILHSRILGLLKSAIARVFRSRTLWFLKAGGWDDVRIGVILCIILALPIILRQATEPNNFPQLGWGSITVFLFTLVMSFFTAALPEELLFRGFLQTSFTRWLKSTNRGIFLASLAFGLYHVLRYLRLLSDCQVMLSWQLPLLALLSVILGEFVVGLFLGFAFSSRGSLIIPIMVHTWINTISNFLGSDYSSQVINQLDTWGFLEKLLYVDLLIVVAAGGLLILIWWLTTRWRLNRKIKTHLNVATPEQLISVLQGGDPDKNAHRAYHLACTIIACRPLAVESLKEPEEPGELDELEKLLVESLKKQEKRDELKKLLQDTPGKLRELVNAGILVLPS